MRKFLLYIFLLLAGVTGFTGCEEFLTVEPETQVSQINFWKNEKDVQAAVYNMHQLYREDFGNVVRVYRDRGLGVFDYMNATFKPVCENELSKAWGRADACLNWYFTYKVVAAANNVIDNIYRADLPQDRHDYYLGQAYAIRGCCYRYVAETWGDAPIVEKSEDTGAKARAPWQEVAEFAISDFKRGAELLPPASLLRDASGAVVTSKQMASRGMCYANLAFLYARKAALNKEPGLHQEAVKAAKEVINSGEYELVESPEAVNMVVLLGNSREGIHELDYQNTAGDLKDGGDYLAGACQKYPVDKLATPATKRRMLRIDNATVAALYDEEGDGRLESNVYKFKEMAEMAVSVTQGGAYIYKFRHAIYYNDGPMVGQIDTYLNNEVLIRLADLILLLAEQEEITGDAEAARGHLDVIRKRAGLKPYSGSNLREAIQKERDRELFLEGQYFGDAVRNGTFREKLKGDFKTLTEQDVADGALFLPVSIAAFENNSLMTQTVYWRRNGFSY